MIRFEMSGFDGRAPLLPADTPDYLIDAAPSWAARAQAELDKSTGNVDVTYYSQPMGAVGKGITTELGQSFTVNPADGQTLSSEAPEVALDYPDGSWINLSPDDLAEAQRALYLAELELTSVDCTPHQTDDGWMDETGKIWPSKSAYYESKPK